MKCLSGGKACLRCMTGDVEEGHRLADRGGCIRHPSTMTWDYPHCGTLRPYCPALKGLCTERQSPHTPSAEPPTYSSVALCKGRLCFRCNCGNSVNFQIKTLEVFCKPCRLSRSKLTVILIRLAGLEGGLKRGGAPAPTHPPQAPLVPRGDGAPHLGHQQITNSGDRGGK